jgi:hypothetical protein
MLDKIFKLDMTIRTALGSIALLFYAFVLVAWYISHERKRDKEADKCNIINIQDMEVTDDDNRTDD